MLQERSDLEAQRQAKELSKLKLDRATPQKGAEASQGTKIALDARARPTVQSADELDGHITDDSD